MISYRLFFGVCIMIELNPFQFISLSVPCPIFREGLVLLDKIAEKCNFLDQAFSEYIIKVKASKK